MRSIALKITLASSVMFALPSPSYGQNLCGNEADECETAMGSYSIALPKGSQLDKPIPALLYFHGAGGSGARAMRNRNMVEAFTKRGYAVIAPSALQRPNSRYGPVWSFLPFRAKQRDELAFAKEVLTDAAKRFSIDRDNIMMGGFSIGGSLTWYLACQDPKVAKAYVPVGGAFWRPHPVATDCKGPVKMMHTHGWRDGTVPLEGRPLGMGHIIQGDVFVGLQVMRKLNSCDQLRANKFKTDGAYWQRWWTKCAPDTALRFVLHPDGHRVPKEWGGMAIKWFEGLDRKTDAN